MQDNDTLLANFSFEKLEEYSDELILSYFKYLVDTNDTKPIEQFLFKKSSRSLSLLAQKRILNLISDFEAFPFEYRVNASTASAYKVIELASEKEQIEEARLRLINAQKHLDKVSESENFRFSQRHLFYSSSFCMLHLLILLEDAEKFSHLLQELFEELKRLDFPKTDVAYHSTHHNVIRILALYLLYFRPEASETKFVLNAIIRSTKASSRFIKLNHVLFYEYLESSRLCSFLFKEFSSGINKKEAILFEDLFGLLIHVNKSKKLITDKAKVMFDYKTGDDFL